MISKFVMFLVVYFIVMLTAGVGLYVAVNSSYNTTGTVISVKPDTQITYNDITIKVGNQNITSSISCTGNFQFVVGQNISVRVTYAEFKYWQGLDINSLPAGCAYLGRN